MEAKILEELKLDEKGLIPTIVQDVKGNQVLMMAYMNRDSLERTLETGYSHFFSRSRQRIWMKGEESGHRQRVKEILLDCDRDTLLIRVEQEVAACHTGHRSCFFTRYDPASNQLEEVEPLLFDPRKVYRQGG
jgi:phosphoribosyl-ATP pyrophosphohydrolase/phosphoribosyl-AMP cyclohydrolase